MHFYIVTPSKSYKFKALSVKDKQKWVDAIELITARNDKQKIEHQFQETLMLENNL